MARTAVPTATTVLDSILFRDALLAEARAACRAESAEVFANGTAVRAHQKAAAGQRGAAPPPELSGARAAA